MKEVVGDAIIIWWLEQFCDPSFLSTVKMAWVDRGCWVDNFLFCNVFVIWLDDVVVITWFVKKFKKVVNSTPLSSHAIFTVLLFTQFHMLNQKMFFSCTVLSILYILEEVLMCPVLRLVLEFLNYLRNVSPSSSTNLTKPGSSISSSTLQIILPHYHSSNYANHLLQLLLQHLHFLRPTQKYHTHLYIHRSLFQNHHHCLFFFGLSKKFLARSVVLLFWF